MHPRAPPHALRHAVSAGSPLPRRIFDQFHRIFGVKIGQLYGTTEFGSVTYNALTSTANIGIRDLQAIDMDRWVLVSPYHILGRAQAWIFAVDVNVALARECIVVICVTVAFSWILLRSRIASVVRA